MDTAKQYWDLDPSDGVVNSGSMLSMFQGLYDVGLLLDDRDHVFDLYCDDGRILYCLCRLHIKEWHHKVNLRMFLNCPDEQLDFLREQTTQHFRNTLAVPLKVLG